MSCLISEWKQALNPKEGNACFSSSQIPRVVVLNYIFAVLRERWGGKRAGHSKLMGTYFCQCKKNNNNFCGIGAYSCQVALGTHRTWCLTKLLKRD